MFKANIKNMLYPSNYKGFDQSGIPQLGVLLRTTSLRILNL